MKTSLISPLLFCSSLLLLSSCKEKAAGPDPNAPRTVNVEVSTIVTQDVPIKQTWLGALRGTEDASIRPQVTGYLMAKTYTDGSYVKKGDVLFKIDARPFQAALDKAQGSLRQQQAMFEKFTLDVERYTPLVKSGAVSRKQLDDAIQSKNEAEASVQSAQAAVNDAQINLQFTDITAPISGLIGVAKPSIGDLLSPGASELLTTISAINPIRVDFSITDRDFLDFTQFMTNNGVDLEAKANKHTASPKKELNVILSDGSLYEEKGEIVALDNNFNKDMGTIQVVGQIPNNKLMLRPGMFVRIEAVTRVIKGAVLVPEIAIMPVQNTYFIIGVDKDDKPFFFPVNPGPTYEHMQVVEPIRGQFPPNMKVVVKGTQQAAQAAQLIKTKGAKITLKMTPYQDVMTQPLVPSRGAQGFNSGDANKPVAQPVTPAEAKRVSEKTPAK